MEYNSYTYTVSVQVCRVKDAVHVADVLSMTDDINLLQVSNQKQCCWQLQSEYSAETVCIHMCILCVKDLNLASLAASIGSLVGRALV